MAHEPRLRSLTGTEDGQDLAFLRLMLFEAIFARDPSPPPIDEGLAFPRIRAYYERWGRAGDDALIAEASDHSRIGAAWYRLFPADAPSYGWVAADVPELAIAVVSSARGGGVGRALLSALIDRARSAGYRALSLSVEDGNQSVHLYDRAGFVRFERDDSENAWTMLLEL